MTREEALNKVRQMSLPKETMEILEALAPELAESEDEKIRKSLYEFFDNALGKDLLQKKCGLNPDKVLTYLEKRKEHALVEPEPKTPDWVYGNWDDEYMINTVIGRYSLHAEVAKKRGDTHDYNLSKSMENWLRSVVKPLIVEKQKEQKSIIQDVELNDAVYDYVRDHFIAGADFTPEYIKKLMENAFFAGVDYYLLKQKSESCESDTNVEKVIEDVIRVYGKTQGEWVGGYDVDTLIVNLRRAFNKKEQKPAEWSEEDEEILKLLILNIGRYMYFGGMSSERILSFLKSLRSQPKQEWSEEDENVYKTIMDDFNGITPMSKAYKLKAAGWLKSLRPSWKPSEEQMNALLNAEGFLRAGLQHDSAKTIAELYEQLKKL